MAGDRRPGGGQEGTRVSSRNKRAEIIASATDYFGRDGYEGTKWADVATAVGLGSTALYHYFESKQHCLYVIMAEATEAARAEFEQVTEGLDFTAGFAAALRAQFELRDAEVLRNRVLVAQQNRVGGRHTNQREEEARRSARAHRDELEVAWATFLARGMEQGAIPEADARLLSRAILGASNSVWHWYRPGGVLSLKEVADFYVPRMMAMAGLVGVEVAKPV
jgi:AcrR family transcriptional regulator